MTKPAISVEKTNGEVVTSEEQPAAEEQQQEQQQEAAPEPDRMELALAAMKGGEVAEVAEEGAVEQQPPQEEQQQAPPEEQARQQQAPASELWARLTEAEDIIRRQSDRLKQFERGQPPLESYAEQAKKDTWGTLQKLGISLQDVLAGWQGDDQGGEQGADPDMDDPTAKAVAEIRSTVQKLAEKLDAQAQAQQEAEDNRAYGVVADRLAVKVRNEPGDRWSLVNDYRAPGSLEDGTERGSLDIVIGVARRQLARGERPDFEQILDDTEEWLLARQKSRAQRLTANPKTAALLGTNGAREAQQQQRQQPAATPAPQAGLGPGTSNSLRVKKPHEMSDDERLDAAVAAMSGEKNG